ncbi:sensor histidine kinase [Flavobacterium hauense]
MKKWLQKNIVYLIALIILVTLAIQTYWNIKNYEANKINVNNEVLAALNSSLDTYYADMVKSDLKSSIIKQGLRNGQEIPEEVKSIIDEMVLEMEATEHSIEGGPDSVKNFYVMGDSPKPPVDITELLKEAKESKSGVATGTLKLGIKDSLSAITNLATKIIISIAEDTINLNDLSKNLNKDLREKGFNFSYALSHIDGEHRRDYGNPKDPQYELSVESGSAYLPSGTQLKMYYSNINLIALKEGLVGILLSFLFTVAIIISLIYLLRIIKQQKQLVLSKNDFISNISHELKTPIATSLSALEALQHFNADNDREKTEKYMGIASQQLQKLTVMVEKILDTAALDSDRIALQKEMADVIPLIRSVVEKHQINTTKSLFFTTETNILLANIDTFHFENVINNIVENAIKYGGNTITLNVKPGLKDAIITIADDGTPIDKILGNKIFDKFYRISTNNRHDVKGYGIGLYYSRNIIEKHNGKLVLEDDAKQTVFKITLPYA